MVQWEIVVGLALGGVIAAPLTIYVCKKLPTRLLMALISILLMFLTLRNLAYSDCKPPMPLNSQIRIPVRMLDLRELLGKPMVH